MARTVSMESLEQKIAKAEQDVEKAKKAYDTANAELKSLLEKRDAVRNQKLLKAIDDSPLSFDEIMDLIQSAEKQA